MVADPSHLTRGVGAATDRGAAGAAAVTALNARRTAALPQMQPEFGWRRSAGGGGKSGVTTGGGGSSAR